jgi:hypothetical protein
MARIAHMVLKMGELVHPYDLKKLNCVVSLLDTHGKAIVVIGRYGTNKAALRKLLAKEEK